MGKKFRILTVFCVVTMLIVSQISVGYAAEKKTTFNKSTAVKSVNLTKARAGAYDNNRFGGADRFETASKIALSFWNKADTAFIVNGRNYPDALSAGPLAAANDAPILLCETNSLPNSTLSALTSLNVKNVVIIGGTKVISTNVESLLKSKFTSVKRIAGSDRYETSALVAGELKKVVGEPTDVAIVSGLGFADALSISPVASSLSMPILLVRPTEAPKFISDYLASSKKIETGYIVGGQSVLSDNLKKYFKDPVRLGGVDRFDTNLKVMQYFDVLIDYDHTFLASGLDYADALSGAVIAGLVGGPMVLVRDSMTPQTLQFVGKKLTSTSYVYVLGGKVVVPDKAMDDIVSVFVPDDIAINHDLADIRVYFGDGDSQNSVTKEIFMPIYGEYGSKVKWTSSNPAVINEYGEVTRPVNADATVNLTATIVRGEQTKTKTFTVIVKKAQ